MKKLTIFVCCLLLLASCKDKNSIEVIPNYDEIYLATYKIDSQPKLIGANEKELARTINEKIKELSIKKTVRLDYKLYIDENGNVDKVKVMIGVPNKKFMNIALEAFQDWEFKPGMLNSKNVKSQYRWFFTSGKNTNLANINQGEFFKAVGQMPMPIGGLKGIQEKIYYPEIAKRAGIEGKVYVKAYIDENGNVVATEILKGIGVGCDESAEKAVLKTKFKPGMQNNKPVKTQVVVPIVFKLDSSNIGNVPPKSEKLKKSIREYRKSMKVDPNSKK